MCHMALVTAHPAVFAQSYAEWCTLAVPPKRLTHKGSHTSVRSLISEQQRRHVSLRATWHSTQPWPRQNLPPTRFTFCAVDVTRRPFDLCARPVRPTASLHPSAACDTLCRAPSRDDDFDVQRRPQALVVAAVTRPWQPGNLAAWQGGARESTAVHWGSVADIW